MDEKSDQRKNRKPLPKPGRKQNFREAMEATFRQYSKALEKRAKEDTRESKP